MYGTVAHLHIKPGMEAKFLEIGRSVEAARIPGHIETYVYRLDDTPNEFYMAVIFADRESYHANADSPEQHERFLEMMGVLEHEPEWHDGEIVSHNDG